MPPNVVLQPDDLQLLRLLATDFILLNTHEIQRLFPLRSPRALRMRVKKLVLATFLCQRYPDTAFFSSAAPEPFYYLGPEGQKVLDPERRDSHIQSRIKRARNFSTTALPHLLFADSVHITFLTAARDHPDYELVDYIPQYDPIWKTLGEHGLPVRPDGYAEYSLGGRTFHCFIEADRGTHRAPHFSKRLAAYSAYAASGTFQAHFSTPSRFRVLFITTTPNRARRLLKAVAPHDPDLFWIATRQDFYTQPLFQPYWMSTASDAFHALDEPTEFIPVLPEAPAPLQSDTPQIPEQFA